jgi:hypothetical protein
MGGVKGHFRFDSFYCRNHNGGVTSPIVYNTIDDRFTNETSTLLNKLDFMQVKLQQIIVFIFFNICRLRGSEYSNPFQSKVISVNDSRD